MCYNKQKRLQLAAEIRKGAMIMKKVICLALCVLLLTPVSANAATTNEIVPEDEAIQQQLKFVIFSFLIFW